MSKNSALFWKSILAIIVTVVGLISFFFPNIALLFRQSLHWHTLVHCIWDFWHPHILMCCSRSYRSSLNSAIYMLRCRSLSHPLYTYAAMILNNGVLGVVHQYRLFSSFSKWLPNNLLFLRAHLIHLFLEANCIEFF